jgi:hypothetical protein
MERIMTEIKDGGPAFPTLMKAGDLAVSEGGASLRDYFAAKALQGLLGAGMYDTKGANQCALESYELADAMLRARGHS